MSNSFKKILIPVDFTTSTEVAVKKGLELAEDGTVIHLLHVLNKPIMLKDVFVRKKTDRFSLQEVDQRMKQWQSTIEAFNENVKVETWVAMKCAVQNVIEIKAKQMDADLIIICKKSQHSWLPFLNTVCPNKLVQNIGKPVLTVKPGSIHNKVKTVIIPVSEEIIDYKIEVISTICQKFRVNVHLVTFANSDTSPDEFFAAPLLQLYQWIKSNLHCPVEYNVLYGANRAKALLKYAEKVNADMLLVCPKMETKLSWLNTHISDVLPPASKMQVLAVQPATTYS